jgi:hypothetical protein
MRTIQMFVTVVLHDVPAITRLGSSTGAQADGIGHAAIPRLPREPT